MRLGGHSRTLAHAPTVCFGRGVSAPQKGAQFSTAPTVRRMRSRATIPIAATVLVGLAAIVTVAGVRYHLSHRDLKFNRAAWIKPVGWCRESSRGRMVNDLVATHLRKGMPMTRVRHLLGPPEEMSDGDWVYNVNREDEVFLDTCVTLERQTQRGRLKHVSVGRDS